MTRSRVLAPLLAAVAFITITGCVPMVVGYMAGAESAEDRADRERACLTKHGEWGQVTCSWLASNHVRPGFTRDQAEWAWGKPTREHQEADGLHVIWTPLRAVILRDNVVVAVRDPDGKMWAEIS